MDKNNLEKKSDIPASEDTGKLKSSPIQSEGSEEEIDEYDDSLNEAEIPIVISKKRKKKSTSARNKKRKKRHTKRDLENFRRSFIDIISASGEVGPVKPLKIFNIRIRWWPVIVLAFIITVSVALVMKNGQITTVNQEISVVGLADDLEGYKILVLSDLNSKRFGDEQSLLLRSIDSVKYDIILCVGDMVGESGDPEPFYEFLDGLSRPSKVYFICGDSDPGPYVETPRAESGTLRELVLEDWILGAIERGANYVDAPMKIKVGEANIWLSPTTYLNTEATAYRLDWKEQMEQEETGVVSGISSDYNSLPITSYRYLLAKTFFTAANSIKSSDLLIGMSHVVPDDEFIVSAATHDDDDGVYMEEPELIVSGHYCGGMWNLPFIGAFYVPNRMLPNYGWFPDQEDVKGLSHVGESQIYISGGLSNTSAIKLMPFRILNDPEMTVIKLTASLPESMLD